ncbi:MAG TPA: VWA domain-containing protein [Cellvibrionaceae bacterium]
MFELAWPWLLILLPLPLLMRFLPAKKNREPALKVPFFNALNSISAVTGGQRRRPFGHLCLWLIWALCVLAASDPRWVGEPESVPFSGRDLMLAVDLSASMLETDMVPPGVTTMQFQNQQYTRLDAVKDVIGDFVTRRQGDRLGLILFADNAYLQAPLSHDSAAVNQLLQESFIGLAGRMTAIGDALGLAIKHLKDNPTNSLRLILLSDGENNAGVIDPVNAAEKARELGIVVYTIAFGADDMIVQTTRGPRRHNPSRDLDEQTLQRIAELTGGQYFRARSTEELHEIHQTIDQLEPVELDQLLVRPIISLFYWPLGAALILSLLLALARLWLNKPSRLTESIGESTGVPNG